MLRPETVAECGDGWCEQLEEQTRKTQKLACDVQLLEHQRDAAERESASVREELREMETRSARLSESDSTVAGELQRLREHIKKLELQRDLALQRCANADAKLKALEGCLY